MHGVAKDIDILIAAELGDGNFEYIPQFFFAKRVDYRNNDAGQVYAESTTRDRLRDEFQLDMLAYDPGFRELERQAVRI